MFIIVLCKLQSTTQLLFTSKKTLSFLTHTKISKTNKVANPIKGANLHGLLLKKQVLKMSARKSMAAFFIPLEASHLAPTGPALASSGASGRMGKFLEEEG